MNKILICAALLCALALAQQEEEQILSRVCKWNTCFKNCMSNHTLPTRAGCKSSCNCWFLAAEDEQALENNNEEL
jgi:hypothetical protein